MKRWAPTAIASIVSFAIACAAPQDAESDEPSVDARALAAAPRIVGGTPSPAAEDAIVKLEIAGAGICTGTLVAPGLVITARHCLARLESGPGCGAFGSELEPASIAVYTGVAGTTLAAHGSQIFAEHDTDACAHDIGLLLLDHPIAGASVAPVRTSPIAIEETTSASGFGEDGRGQTTSGRYDKSGLLVLAVGPTVYTYVPRSAAPIAFDVPAGDVVTGESTCFGDSGGPLLDAQGRVIAVTSRGVDGVCLDRPTIYTALAAHATLVQTALDASGHGVEGVIATPRDPDRDAGDDDAAPLTRATPAARTTMLPSAGCALAAGPTRAPRDPATLFVALAALLLARRRSSVD